MNITRSQRDRDRAVILNLIRRAGPLARTEIQRFTNLRQAAVSQLTNELIAEGRLLEAGPSNNPSGRKQILLKLNPEQAYILAVEFDSESTTAAVVNANAEIVALWKSTTPTVDSDEAMLEHLAASAHQVLDQRPEYHAKLHAMVVADVGIVDKASGLSIYSAQMPFWRNVPVAAWMETRFGVPATVETSTRCRAIGERVMGAGSGSDHMIYIEYGAGIGAAIFSAGTLIEGAQSAAGEFGHTKVSDSGRPCKCGSLGCLEAHASPSAIAELFRRYYVSGTPTSALPEGSSDVSRVDGWSVMRAARRGDKLSALVLEEILRYLSIGISNLVNLFNPALIVLDQRLTAWGDPLIEQLTRLVRLHSLSYSTQKLVIRFGTLKEEVGVQGAALIELERLFEIPLLKPPKYLVDNDELMSSGAVLQARAERLAALKSTGS